MEREDIQRCLECGDEIKYGRTDKKFCCEKCKNEYHNKETNRTMRIQSKTIHALGRNYDILKSLINMKIDSMDLDEIILKGFNTECFTGVIYAKFKRTYICFNIRYRMSENRIFRIEYIRNI